MMDKYDILKFAYAPAGAIAAYLNTLDEQDLLKERFTDLHQPTPMRTVDLICKAADRFFFVLDKERREIIGEFMISDTISDAGLIHFSMSPTVKGNKVLSLIREVTDEVLHYWRKEGTDEPYVRSLLGVTPVENRRACLVIQRCGFKKIATIPYAGKYNGVVCDAILTIKTIN